MATANHYPDAGFQAGISYPQTSLLLSGIPGTLATWEGFTALSGTDLTKLNTDDTYGVVCECYLQSPPGTAWAGGVLMRFTMNDGTVSQLDITVKGYDIGGSTFNIYAWNFNTSAFDFMGSHTGGAPSAYTFTHSITTNPDYYIDGSGYMWLLVCPAANQSSSGKTVRYAEVVDTYSAVATYDETGGGTDVVVDVGEVDVQAYVESGGGSTVAVSMGGDELQYFVVSAGTNVAVATGGHDVQTYLNTGGGTDVAVTTGGHDHIVSSYTELGGGTVVLVSTGGSDVRGIVEMGGGTNVLTDTGGSDIQHYVDHTGFEVAVETGEHDMQLIPLFVSVPSTTTRRISWANPDRTVFIIIDGTRAGESSIGYVDFESSILVRGVLLGSVDYPTYLPCPGDEVLLTISDDPVLHHIDRDYESEGWERIASILGTSYKDGPLDDGHYDYRAVNEDDEGDTSVSDTKSVDISSVPDAPSSFTASWDSGTQTLTFSIGASPSADAAQYSIRESDSKGLIALSAAPAYQGTSRTWHRVMTTETGIYSWLARTVDSDGNEDKGIIRIITLAFSDGVLVGMPAEPRIVDVYPAAGGQETVEWLYDPYYEDPQFSAAAYEARIYSDSGASSGMDFSTPIATVAMSNPTVATRFTWTNSSAGTGDQWKYVVRIATAAWPDGFETQNIDPVWGTTPVDDDVPATPTITAAVISYEE
jgi:hypothetical protein